MNEGQTLAHYTIIRPLGKGGTGELYLAHARRMGKKGVVIR